MLSWTPNFSNTSRPSILCLGAHCDDIEIGCGGLLTQLAQRYPDALFQSVIFSSTPEREIETRTAHEQLMTGANDIQIETLKFRNSYFPYEGVKIKEYFKTLQSTCKPDLILTHYRNDMHQDHRLISELTWNTYRDHAVLEYEIPKFDGDLGQPNVFVPLAEAAVNEKIQCLMKNFPSQVTRSWFTEETFLGLLRLRGIECNSATGYAEGYFARKLNVSI